MEPLVVGIIVLVLLYIAYYLYVTGREERMGDVFYSSNLANKSMDPLKTYYSFREKDVTGMSAEDYYYENQTNAGNYIAPQYLQNDTKYVDHTDYLGMPLEWRPARPASCSKMQMQPALD